MRYIERLIERELESNKNCLLDADWSGSLSFYQDDIYSQFCEYLDVDKISDVDAEQLSDFIAQNQDQLLEYVKCSFPHYNDRFFAIGDAGEIEIQLPRKLSEKRIELLNKYSDLFVDEAGELAYISCVYDYVAVYFSNIDLDELREFTE